MGEDGPAVRFFGVLFRALAWIAPIVAVLLVAIGAAAYFYR